MPAVLTHHLFGREVYERRFESLGAGKDAFEAYLVGCQGPDVLFFAAADPILSRAWKVGQIMHRSDPVPLLTSFSYAVSDLPNDLKPIGRAYLRGFVCHYLLDSKVHPLIYAQQNELTEAGIQGLDRTDEQEVHAHIESELDMLMLSVKRGQTIKQFGAPNKALSLSSRAAKCISYLYKRVVWEVYRIDIPKDAFTRSLSAYRRVLVLLHSPSGIKRAALGAIERIARTHSFLQAMSMRNELLESSPFANEERRMWVDPGTGKARHESFWDLYDQAFDEALIMIPALDAADAAYFDGLTEGLDFRGCPTRATILEVADAES